ncbi:MAG: hypothetical protein QM775_03050 [Pirellulales bacterium]
MKRSGSFVLLVVLGIVSFVGCEPPPTAEKKAEAKPIAKAETPHFAPRATLKPTPSPTVMPSPTVVKLAPVAPAAPPKRPSFEQVALPNGRTLTRGMLFLDRPRMVPLFPTVNVAYFMESDDKEQLTGAFAFSTRDGKWYGTGIAYQPDHVKPRFIAQFTDAVRDGNFWGWNAAGRSDYWSEFRKGRREGLTALIKNSEPTLVQLWQNNLLKSQYLVELIDNKEFKAREVKPSDAAIDGTMQQLTAELKLIEEKYLEEEKAHRREFVEFNEQREDFEEYDRLTRGVAGNTPGKREEARRRQEFDARQRRLFLAWQMDFWKTPL